MKRIIVLGGTGFFGGLIVDKLRAAGLEPHVASRHSEFSIDADNADDLRAHLKQRDLVIDAAGPFQKRSPALIEAAAKIGFDVIDLSDSVAYTSMVQQHEAPISAAGIRVLTACSSLSTVSAAVLGMSSVAQPRRLTAYLRPASRLTANSGSIASFLGSLTGVMRTVRFDEPLGRRSGVVVKSVDGVTLPKHFPSLRETELVVDAGIVGANFLLRRPELRQLLMRNQSVLVAVARRIGPTSGILAYEIATTGGYRHQLFTGESAHLAAVIPAVMAAQSIAAGTFPHRGVVPPTQHVERDALFEAMSREGVTILSS
jgi:hypothetical protein